LLTPEVLREFEVTVEAIPFANGLEVKGYIFA
jgi:hypothetical protein